MTASNSNCIPSSDHDFVPRCGTPVRGNTHARPSTSSHDDCVSHSCMCKLPKSVYQGSWTSWPRSSSGITRGRRRKLKGWCRRHPGDSGRLHNYLSSSSEATDSAAFRPHGNTFYRATEFLNTQMGGAVNKESKEQRSTMSFTKKEMDEYIAKFMNIDRDHKGYITMVDLKR